MHLDDSEHYPPYDALLGRTLAALIVVCAIAYGVSRVLPGNIDAVLLAFTLGGLLSIAALAYWWRGAVRASGYVSSDPKSAVRNRVVWTQLVIAGIVTVVSYTILSATHNAFAAFAVASAIGTPALVILLKANYAALGPIGERWKRGAPAVMFALAAPIWTGSVLSHHGGETAAILRLEFALVSSVVPAMVAGLYFTFRPTRNGAPAPESTLV